MKTFTAKDAKNRFGALMDSAHIEPVKITKNGRDFLVVLSVSRYEELNRDKQRGAIHEQ
jgi:prevent-host-death family protein